MTTTTPDRITPDELRAEFASLHSEIADLRTALAATIEGLHQAASVTVPTPAQTTIILPATRLERESAKGKTYYRMFGGQYTRYGIRIWPETLAAIGLADVVYANDDSYTINPPLLVRALVEPHKDREGNEITGPTKIIGLA